MKRVFLSGIAVALAAICVVFPAGRFRSVASAADPDGKAIYTTNCSSCHQTNGEGVSGTFPPLAKNDYVTGDVDKVIHTLLAGKSDKITVNGVSYEGQMPPWKGTLSNAEIAAVATYIRSSWGNKASAVTEDQVAKAK